MKLRKKHSIQDVLERTYVTKSVLTSNSDEDYLDDNLLSFVRPVLETETHVFSVYKTPYYLSYGEPKLHYETMIKIETKESFENKYISLGEVIGTFELKPCTFEGATLLYFSEMLNIGLIQNGETNSIDLNNIMFYTVKSQDLEGEQPVIIEDLHHVSSTEIATLLLESSQLFDDYVLMNTLVEGYITSSNNINYFAQGITENFEEAKEQIEGEIELALKTNALEFVTKNKEDIEGLLQSPYIIDSVIFSNQNNKKQIKYDTKNYVIEELDATDLKNLYIADCKLTLMDLELLNKEYLKDKESFNDYINLSNDLLKSSVTTLYAYQTEYQILPEPNGKALLQIIDIEKENKRDSSSVITDESIFDMSFKN